MLYGWYVHWGLTTGCSGCCWVLVVGFSGSLALCSGSGVTEKTFVRTDRVEILPRHHVEQAKVELEEQMERSVIMSVVIRTMNLALMPWSLYTCETCLIWEVYLIWGIYLLGPALPHQWWFW